MRLSEVRLAQKFLLFILLLSAAAPQPSPGQQPTGAGTQTASTQDHESAPEKTAPPAPEPASAASANAMPTSKATLADFAWLAGHWQGAWGPRAAQQAWMSPKAGVMLGIFQVSENDKTLVIEVFTLVEKPQGIELRMRHLTPTLVPWEKDGAIVLNLLSTDPKSSVFENPADGRPKRAVFTRLDADTFVSRSEIAPPDAAAQVTEITYHRMRETPPAKSKR